jgi:hypothetical protein
MVNIDTVYQRVLAIANKEQRGYITPLEFNLLANQAGMDIFEQYFYDRNKLADLDGNSVEYSNADNILEEKIAQFSVYSFPLVGANLPIDLYRLGAVFVRRNVTDWANYTGAIVGPPDPSAVLTSQQASNTWSRGDHTFYEAKLISNKDWVNIQNAPLLRPTDKRPVYLRSSLNNISVIGSNNQLIGPIYIDYIQQPVKVEWGYDVIGEKALFNGSLAKTTHFPHHPSEETTLVVKILELAGVIIEDPNIVQYANTKQSQTEQQQKS